MSQHQQSSCEIESVYHPLNIFFLVCIYLRSWSSDPEPVTNRNSPGDWWEMVSSAYTRPLGVSMWLMFVKPTCAKGLKIMLGWMKQLNTHVECVDREKPPPLTCVKCMNQTKGLFTFSILNNHTKIICSRNCTLGLGRRPWGRAVSANADTLNPVPGPHGWRDTCKLSSDCYMCDTCR